MTNIAIPETEIEFPPRRTWTREEFDRAWQEGIFGPEERLELIEGEIITKRTQHCSHATAISLALRALIALFAGGFHLRIQLPLALGPASQPEPDIAVVTGSERDYAAMHPTTAVLVIEISDTSVPYDRTTKAGLYARAGIPEYWIINLIDRVLEVHRDPIPMTGRPFGHYYRSVIQYTETDSLAPLAAPNHPIVVRDLLP